MVSSACSSPWRLLARVVVVGVLDLGSQLAIVLFHHGSCSFLTRYVRADEAVHRMGPDRDRAGECDPYPNRPMMYGSTDKRRRQKWMEIMHYEVTRQYAHISHLHAMCVNVLRPCLDAKIF